MKLFFESTKTGKRYQVIKMDKEAGTITLKGKVHEFTEKYDKEAFEKNGYKLVKVEEEEEEDA